MKRAFTSLDPQEALHAAIFIEERNAQLYQRFAEMFMEFHDGESLEIASVFWEMSLEEKRHSSLLQHKYTERYGNAACAVTEDDLQELIEVPRLENGNVFDPPSGDDDLAPRERAIHVALKAEQSAQRYYSSLVGSTKEDALRNLYRELADMEDGHIGFLERKLKPHSANSFGPI